MTSVVHAVLAAILRWLLIAIFFPLVLLFLFVPASPRRYS